MALSTIALLDQALKTTYKGVIIKQIDERSGPIMAALNKSTEHIVGNKFKFPLQYGRHGGLGARAEAGALPTANPRSYKQGEAESKNIFGRISITDKLLRTSKDNAASFASQLNMQMEDIVSDAQDMLRRNLIKSSSGVMGTVSAAISSKTALVVVGNILYFYPGQIIDVLTDTAGTVVKAIDGVRIVDVDYDTNTLTLESSSSCAAGESITIAGSYGLELTGLEQIMTKNNIVYGINRATNKWFNPRAYAKNNAYFNSIDWLKAIHDIDNFTGERPDFIVCNSDMAQVFYEEQLAYKTNIDYMDVKGGYRKMSFQGIPISDEKYMPSGISYLLTLKYLTLGQLADWDWMDDDGKILSRVTDRAAYEATLVKYAELLCTKPAAQAAITGVSLTPPVDEVDETVTP